MSKKKKLKRDILPDPVYNNVVVAKFINQVMRQGKKNAARKIVYGAFDIIKEKTKKDSLEIFNSALENAASVSALLLTTEAVIGEIKESKEKGPAMPPGGGYDEGMY